MRTFANFPEQLSCPVCNTNENKECFLLPIDGTTEGRNCEAQPTHTSCISLDKLRINKEAGLIYYNLDTPLK